jgi:hypothetical protein
MVNGALTMLPNPRDLPLKRHNPRVEFGKAQRVKRLFGEQAHWVSGAKGAIVVHGGEDSLFREKCQRPRAGPIHRLA